MKTTEEGIAMNTARINGMTTQQLVDFYYKGRQGASIMFATPEGNFLSPKAVEQAIEKARAEERDRIEKEVNNSKWGEFLNLEQLFKIIRKEGV